LHLKRQPAGSVDASGNKTGGQLLRMTEAEIDQLVRDRGTPGRTASATPEPPPAPKPTPKPVAKPAAKGKS
jgi:hypothetical protein